MEEDDHVVFDASAYDVVGSWLKLKKEDVEEASRVIHSKPLYTGAMAMKEEDKLLAAKLLKKKRPQEDERKKEDE
ncbi:hypothetical protein THRCLA_21531, partial [Thraustotheca clavata]